MPAVPLRRQSAGDGRGDGADITRRVQQRETTVATLVVGRIQLAEQTADIGLKQAVAADNNRQRQIQTPDCVRLDAEHHVAERHQYRTGNHCRSVTEQAVGEPAAQNRGYIDQRGVSAEKIDGVAVVKAELVGEIKDEEGTHAVKAEVFPDLNRHDVVDRARL